MSDDIAALLDQYRQAVDDEMLEVERKLKAEGCLDIVQMCGLAENPEDIPAHVQRHIAGCKHCRPLYEELLKTYPDLARPSWLGSHDTISDDDFHRVVDELVQSASHIWSQSVTLPYRDKTVTFEFTFKPMKESDWRTDKRQQLNRLRTSLAKVFEALDLQPEDAPDDRRVALYGIVNELDELCSLDASPQAFRQAESLKEKVAALATA